MLISLKLHSLLSILLLCFALLGVSKSLLASEVYIINLKQASKIISNADSPPDFNQAKSVHLPDHWTHDSQGFYGSVWYELDLNETQQITQQWAIYLPEVNMNAEVWINNTLLGSGGNMKPPISRYWHSPLMFVFSPSDLITDNNKIKIRVVTYANEYGQLGAVQIGERNTINKLYQKTLFNTVNLHIISGILAGVYFLLMILVWAKRRDPVFFWGALVCGSWSISSLNLYVIDPIMPELIWEKLMQISMGWISLFFFMFIRRLNGHPYSHKIEGSILFGAFIINLTLIFTSEIHLFFISRNFHIYTIIWAIVSIIIVFYTWIKYKRSSQIVMIIAFALIAMSGIHDILVQNKIIESGEAFWLNYSVPIILLMIGYLMVRRFLQAVQQSEQLNRDLEIRVQKAHDKIESDYEKILLLETEQASNHERERIYRNLHDDMGSKLLSLVYETENIEVAQLARGAMNDLRAIVSKKPNNNYLLSDMIEQWQTDSQRRCSKANFKFSWKQKKIPLHFLLNTDDYQNCISLQAEAVSNIMKHSTGNSISIIIKCRFNCLQISIFDNGDYSHLKLWQEGRGISSMRFRVKQLHGKIRWQPLNNKGGVVRWVFPISIKQ